MWTISSPVADLLFNISNIVLILGALAVFVGTIGSVIMAGVRDQFANERISVNEAETAKANEHTAELEGKSLMLKLELEREIQKRAPRSLTEEQKSILVSELRGKIQEINVVVQQDFESRRFAQDFEIAFSQAGIAIHPYELPPGDQIAVPAGIMMYKPGGNQSQVAFDTDPLCIALKKIGLYGGNTSQPFSSFQMLHHNSSIPIMPVLPRDIYTVYIGQKLPW